MSDITSIQYEAMQQVARSFQEESVRISRVMSVVENHLNTLKGGGWIADAATQMYREMDSEVCPAIKRLQDALTAAAEVSNEIARTLLNGEEEACGCLPSEAP
jgi:WXG100 family type VII secretion target